MTYWWVNQGQSWEQEREGGYLWAPLADGAGHRLGHWEAMADVAPGDTVFHYARGAIRAIGRVVARAELARRPYELPDQWEAEGRLVRVSMIDVSPIALDEIPLELRLAETKGPFDKHGRIKQAYLFEVSDGFAQGLRSRFARLGSLIGEQPQVYRLNVAGAQLASCLTNAAFAISGPRAAMEPGDILLLQLNLADARAAGEESSRIRHAIVFERAEADPTGSISRRFWPSFEPQRDGHILHGSAVIPIPPFSFTTPPFSKDYWSAQNAVRLDDTDAAIVLERIKAGGVDPTEATTTGAPRRLAADANRREAIEKYAVRVARSALGARFPDSDVIEMPRNNPGFDLEVLDGQVPRLYVEVKGTTAREPVFLMSENERDFSARHAGEYELHVVWGIDLDADKHIAVERRTGEVRSDTHGISPWQWQGRLP